jgi:uncharacterized YigZ family protein
MMEYKTIRLREEAEFIERRSRFIGHACPVKTEEEAVAFINEMKAKYWDASHNVYAYCLREGQIKRYSDDGEPQGTAGIPVLDVLQKSGVVDTAVVVTRYFGGILLGAGGLVRAYSHGASIALEAAGIVTMGLCTLGVVSCSYSQYGRVAALIPEKGGVVDTTDFGENVNLFFHIPKESFDFLQAALIDATSGTCHAQAEDEAYYELG